MLDVDNGGSGILGPTCQRSRCWMLITVAVVGSLDPPVRGVGIGDPVAGLLCNTIGGCDMLLAASRICTPCMCVSGEANEI